MDLDLKKKIDDLSFGNKKKVGIVQGLIHEPKLIILDEPTSGLDPLMQQKFFELIAQENKKGATVFLSSHILSEVQKMCERVALIKDGRIIKLEKMSELKENNFKRIKIETPSNLDKTFFEMAGVSKLEFDGKSISFLFNGDINKVIQRLAQTEILNLSVDEPDLEEIFMHYYVKED
jgi:ABC-2 type transport system ATP-binding protein